ncbi:MULTISPECIES: PepSY-associated TM helix domain-containing protein [unclassified Halomonas]|uniref:PepSY-associated TM helix domain-containing protein n=1 Tax=unclassified Halomonas TaxID=2609666 RepID=UPI001CF39E20|nr:MULTISPECIES: PepSY domain-containing protein [unclassified Halomonas]MCA8865504.1 PepSY domain-containing protein [Halomonas sp. SBBP1]UZH10758.1 PepSY domain-containing protein [Halomonas sp. BDJS001]
MTASTLPSIHTGKLLFALISRLHLYIGLFVGPFILIAALSGIAYLLSPPLEEWLYHDTLYGVNQGEPQPLAEQIAAAQRYLDSATLPSAVRPAPEPGSTTRLMYSEPSLGPSEHRAVFVDPISLEVTGDSTVYGTSGILPLRTAIDHFHRQLLMGNVGRLYSELAASWLWVAALGGVLLWIRQRRSLGALVSPHRTRRRHATLGLVLSLGLLFFSATGLTWSQWAGGNIAELRHAWGWGTPSASTALNDTDSQVVDEHAEHHGHMAMVATSITPEDFDRALNAARQAGLSAARMQLTPPSTPQQAWRVAEIDRQWPTQVDQVALHPRSMAVTDQTDFATFPWAAKLTRWGIDLHMGVLFGVANQIVLALIAAGLVTLIGWGYLMAWRRLRAASGQRFPTVAEPFSQLPLSAKIGLLAGAIAVGLALPVLGASLAIFVVIDALRWTIKKRYTARTLNARHSNTMR